MGAFTAPYMDMGADERFGSGDHDRSQRRVKQITGNSPAPETVLEEVERLPCSGSTVPIQGGTGAGNELIARAIHGAGSEKERLKLLLDLTNTLVSNLELRDLLRAVSASIRQVMHCDIVGVWLPDADPSRMRQLAMDFPEGRGFLREDSLRSIAGTNLGIAFTEGKSVVVPKADLMSDQEILGTVR